METGYTFLSLTHTEISVIIVATLITSFLHGATGLAGGFLLAAVLAPIIGIKPLVPIMSIVLLISHFSRVTFNYRNINREVYLLIVLPAIPALVFFSTIYQHIDATWIAGVLGFLILFSIPYRRWAARHMVKPRPATMSVAGFMYGGLTGVSIGPGILLVPLIFGFGISKEAFVGTFAAISLTVNVVRVTTFEATGQLSEGYLLTGLLIGLLTVPGNWLGRSYLHRLGISQHEAVVDFLIFLGGINFLWLMWRSLGVQ